MKATLLSCLFLVSLVLTNLAFAQPKNIQLEYEVSRNGHAFGTVVESYVQEGDQYRIVSTTKGDGLYALLGERVLASSGEVTKAGLKPTKFDLKRGDNASKSLSASFDWTGNVINMLVEGEARTDQLVSGAQDLASYPYQFMFSPPKSDDVKVTLTTGKKLSLYHYVVKARDVEMHAAGKTYKTIHLADAETDGKKKKELWLAESLHYIPVKYLVVDKHGDKIEQNLTKISIK
jgi:hypothetical protein